MSSPRQGEIWWAEARVEDRLLDDLRPVAEVISLNTSAHPKQEDPMPAHPVEPSRPTIDEVFAEFLAEQEKRLAPRTFRNYAEVIDLFGHCLNGYGHQSLDAAERPQWESAFSRGSRFALGFVRPEFPSDDERHGCLEVEACDGH